MADAWMKSDDGRLVGQLLSLPGLGEQTAAIIYSEAYYLLHQRNLLFLRAYCGVAPVTKRSGKTCYHVMRRACNKRLRGALYWIAMGARRFKVSRG